MCEHDFMTCPWCDSDETIEDQMVTEYEDGLYRIFQCWCCGNLTSVDAAGVFYKLERL